MGIALLGTDSLLSNTLDNINKATHIHLPQNYEHTVQDIIESADNTIITKWKKVSSKFAKLANSYRILNVPIINYGIFSIFGYLLVRLTFKYHKLYTKSSILATIATNVVLYGISDTCAQSLSQFVERKANNQRRVWGVHTGVNFTDSVENIQIDPVNGNDPSSFFIDYGDNDFESHISNSDSIVGAHAYVVDVERSDVELETDTMFNFRRFFGFITWGFIMAFIQVVWYIFLNAMFTDLPTIVSILERVLTDQLLFSPVSLACFFAYTTVIIEGGDSNAYRDKMFRLYVTTLAVSISVWFPVQVINFSVMPKKFQVPFSSSVGVIWNCFLSYRNASASKQ